MPVSKFAVQEFMSRRLRNWETLKTLPETELDRRIQSLNPRPTFHTTPYRHQKLSFLVGVENPGFFFMLSMGTGKSKLSLDLIRYRIQQGSVRRALVLVPNVSNVGEWIEQGQIHAPDLKIDGLVDTRETRIQLLLGYSDILVVTYMGWLSLICRRENPKGKRGHLVIDKQLAQDVEQLFDMVVFDESTALKERSSLTFRAANRLSVLRYRLALTGTPFDKDPQDLWAQFKVIDHGETLGKTLGLFRAGYCVEKKSYWSGFPEYKFDKRKKEHLRLAIKNRSIRYSVDECHDLPPSVGSTRRADLPEETVVYYRRMIDQLRELSPGQFPQVEGVYVKMRQLTAGFLKTDDVVIRFPKNPKLELLIELLHEIPDDCKVIVYNEFHVSGDLICERLVKEKIPHLRGYSQTRRKDQVIHQFKHDPKPRVLVGSSTMAFGLNLQVANYVLFFESPDRCILRNQVTARVRRPGQTKPTFYYDLVLRNTVDERILRSLQEGRDLHELLIEGGAQILIEDFPTVLAMSGRSV